MKETCRQSFSLLQYLSIGQLVNFYHSRFWCDLHHNRDLISFYCPFVYPYGNKKLLQLHFTNANVIVMLVGIGIISEIEINVS